MKNINVLVIGAGLYVCGKGTERLGTILPAIYEWYERTSFKESIISKWLLRQHIEVLKMFRSGYLSRS